MKKQQSMRKRGDNWQTNRQKIVECEQTVNTSTNKYMYWISFMYAETLVKSSFMFCLRQSSQSITFCLFTDAGKCRAGSEVRRFRFSKFKSKIWIWFSLCTSWLPYSTLGFQSSNLRFEFDFRFAVVHCPKQLCRYLREKISQQKIQISTITKGVPITKIEVPINKRRTIWVKISVLAPQTHAAAKEMI